MSHFATLTGKTRSRNKVQIRDGIIRYLRMNMNFPQKQAEEAVKFKETPRKVVGYQGVESDLECHIVTSKIFTYNSELGVNLDEEFARFQNDAAINDEIPCIESYIATEIALAKARAKGMVVTEQKTKTGIRFVCKEPAFQRV